MTFPASLQSEYGAPAYATIDISYPVTSAGSVVSLSYDVQWFGKRPTRMAESIWLEFDPVLPSLDPTGTGWMMDKLGQKVSPFNVNVNGSQSYAFSNLVA